MAVFKNRAAALLLCFLVVLGSSVWNVNRSLEKEADKAENLFEAHNGMEEQIENRIGYCSQLWSVARDFPAAAAFRDAYNALYEAEEADDVAAMARANAELTRAAEELHTQILASSMVTDDAEYYYGLQQNAARVMDTAAVDYNAAAKAYQRLIRGFPLALLRPLIFVEAPVPFE